MQKESLPLLGMGTYGMGGRMERDEMNVAESLASLELGLSLGLRLIDTAEVYGAGLCEELVGKAIARVPREQVYIVSKVWREHLRYDDVLRAAEGSLRRLGTDYLDLYLVHWPSEQVPMEETMRAMEHLLDEGIVRAIGVSNFSVVQMREAQKCLTRDPLAASQFEFSLAHQGAAAEMLPYCTTNDILPIAYRPFARWELPTAHGDEITRLAQKYGKTPNQVILNWILSQGIVAIPKTLSSEHMRENAGALGWSLSAEDIASLQGQEFDN